MSTTDSAPAAPTAAPAAAWYPAPDGSGLQYWDGTAWTHHRAQPLRQPQPSSVYARPPRQQQPQQYRGPARTAHGAMYWLIIGLWWEPIKWAGRMLGWLILWPFGLWRTLRKGRVNREARERRGYR